MAHEIQHNDNGFKRGETVLKRDSTRSLNPICSGTYADVMSRLFGANPVTISVAPSIVPGLRVEDEERAKG